jgi:ATP-dependent DNA helicase RecQ
MAKDGICLVITPLIALMKDQVENLQKRGINAVAIHSGMSREEIDFTLDNCIFGDIKFLYLSPERIDTEIFRIRLEKMNVNIIAVDESHCVSQWGYDFRPSYLRITKLREYLPDVPFLALTATATPKVVEDIMEKLQFRERNVFRKSFERKNIAYIVEPAEDKYQRIIRIISGNKGTGIIYVRNRKHTKELALFLQRNDVKADYYHAGLTHEDRSRKQEEWQKGKIRIIVSTNAFGMGIDKPDVRFVIHLDLPDSLEAYFQEAGRAGRDEKNALALLLYNESDRKSVNQRIVVSFPDIRIVKEIYHALGNYYQIPVGGGKSQSFDFVLNDFVSQYKYNILVVHNSLKVLEREGYIEMTDEINNPSRIHFKVQRDDLYKFQVENELFDGFIKLILRSYSGMFSNFVAVDENQLAKRSGLNLKNVYNYLNRLSTLGIIHYIPRKRNPVIVFTEERLDHKNLRFSVGTYQFLKDRYIERADEVLRYATNHNKCRSQMLLAYFGEKDSYRCGQCDICEQRNELGLSAYEFDLINNALKTLLIEDHLLMDEIIKTLTYPEEKAVKVFRWLIEHEKIKKDHKFRYYWVK